MARVALKNLSKNYRLDSKKKVEALRRVDLTVEDGEFMTVIGPSGSGKSTLLRLIAGLEQPCEGSVFIDGEDVGGIDARFRDAAMVFQSLALYPHLTVRDNWSLSLKLRRYSKAEIHSRVMDAAQWLDLADNLDRLPETLSGGQRQRVALGRALVRKPKVLLLDEPLSDLDPRLRSKLRLELLRLHKEFRLTVLHVTHDPVEALSLGDRLSVISAGRLEQTGAPAEVYYQPANCLVAEFMGEYPMNLIRSHLRVVDGKLVAAEPPGANARFRIALPRRAAGSRNLHEGPVILGIRAEHVYCAPASNEGVGNTIQTLAETSECTGPDRYWHLRFGDQSLVLRTPSESTEPINGRPCGIQLDPDRLVFFDAETLQRIEL